MEILSQVVSTTCFCELSKHHVRLLGFCLSQNIYVKKHSEFRILALSLVLRLSPALLFRATDNPKAGQVPESLASWFSNTCIRNV